MLSRKANLHVLVLALSKSLPSSSSPAATVWSVTGKLWRGGEMGTTTPMLFAQVLREVMLLLPTSRRRVRQQHVAGAWMPGLGGVQTS